MQASDIELRPPDAPPVRGRSAVVEYMAHGTSKIQRIEIAERRIRGSKEIAYLTANYQTTFSTMDDPNPRRILGSHLWILRRQADPWLVVLVSWSTWGHAATSSVGQLPPISFVGPCREARGSLTLCRSVNWSRSLMRFPGLDVDSGVRCAVPSCKRMIALRIGDIKRKTATNSSDQPPSS